MRRGDKLLETTIAIAPLLGLLGTVTGLMTTFANLNIGGGGSASPDLSKAAAGIGEALTATAGGMIVAIGTVNFSHLYFTASAAGGLFCGSRK